MQPVERLTHESTQENIPHRLATFTRQAQPYHNTRSVHALLFPRTALQMLMPRHRAPYSLGLTVSPNVDGNVEVGQPVAARHLTARIDGDHQTRLARYESHDPTHDEPQDQLESITLYFDITVSISVPIRLQAFLFHRRQQSCHRIT
jgi:hypothetical protein